MRKFTQLEQIANHRPWPWSRRKAMSFGSEDIEEEEEV
jgi:hypothetical protein